MRFLMDRIINRWEEDSSSPQPRLAFFTVDVKEMNDADVFHKNYILICLAPVTDADLDTWANKARELISNRKTLVMPYGYYLVKED